MLWCWGANDFNHTGTLEKNKILVEPQNIIFQNLKLSQGFDKISIIIQKDKFIISA